MPLKRKRLSSSKNDVDEEDVQLTNNNNNDNNKNNSTNNPFELRIEKLLNSISREVSELKNENKTIKETIFEMKNENDDIKHTVNEIKCTMDKEFNPTPLWKLVTDWKDVFEREGLTKLNRTEQKLFSQTCRASREAVRRAKIKLEDKFWISHLSSISQLELAWANYQWGAKRKYTNNGREYTKTQEMFCARVAHTNDLALLRWVREVKECTWDYRTSAKAAKQGNLEMLKYCVENGCEVHAGTCADAAKYGNLECLKYLHEKNVKWNHRTVQRARENNQIECLNYALANNCPQTREEFLALEAAAAAAALQLTEEEEA